MNILETDAAFKLCEAKLDKRQAAINRGDTNMLERIIHGAPRALLEKLLPQKQLSADLGFRRQQTDMADSDDGVRVAYRLWGKPAANRPALVLVHGLGADQTQFEQDAAWFAERGVAALTLDLRGHGASSRPAPFEKSTLTLDRMATDIERAMDAAKLHEAHLVGNSMGGLAALALIARGGPAKGRIASLTTFGTTYHLNYPAGFPAMHRLIYGVVGHRRFVESVARNATRHDHARAVIRRIYTRYSAELSFLITQNIRKYDLRPAARSFDGPVLLLRADADGEINRTLGPTLDSLKDKPDFEIRDLTDAGHFTNLDQPEAFRTAVLDFIERAA